MTTQADFAAMLEKSEELNLQYKTKIIEVSLLLSSSKINLTTKKSGPSNMKTNSRMLYYNQNSRKGRIYLKNFVAKRNSCLSAAEKYWS